MEISPAEMNPIGPVESAYATTHRSRNARAAWPEPEVEKLPVAARAMLKMHMEAQPLQEHVLSAQQRMKPWWRREWGEASCRE